MSRSGDRARHDMPQRWSRDWIIVLFFVLFVLVIIGNLVYIQVIRGPEYARLADMAHSSELSLSAHRGTVYDRNGEVIASNIDAMTIYVNPQEVAEPDKLAEILAEVLGPATGKTKQDYLSIVDQPNLSFAYILRKADVPVAEALKTRLSDEEVAGVHYIEDTKRVYPNGDIGSQVIGVVDIDGKGISGLELEYDELLKGTDGSVVVARGLNDIPISDGESERTDAVDGIDIVTSIDISLQKYCEDQLLSAIVATEAQGGSVTIMDASNGEIYAACSYGKKTSEELEADAKAVEKAEAEMAAGGPQQDLSKLVSDYKLEAGKLGPITDAYEPGSTFKAFTAFSVLSNNDEVTPDSTFTVPYALEVYDTVITDSHDHPVEDMTLTKILADSSNTGTTLMSRTVALSDLHDTYSAFGFGKKTGADFPGDASGQLEDTADWDGVQSATVTFGQGLTVTPLQIVRAYGALQQDGVISTPHFLVDVPSNEEKAQELLAGLTQRESVGDADTARQVSEMLRSVVTEGTGVDAAIDGFNVVGKTGTAEIASVYGGYEEDAYIMSFCGWLYGSSSDLVCLVAINRPLTSLGAGGLCGAVFADIMSYAAQRYHIDAQAQ